MGMETFDHFSTVIEKVWMLPIFQSVKTLFNKWACSKWAGPPCSWPIKFEAYSYIGLVGWPRWAGPYPQKKGSLILWNRSYVLTYYMDCNFVSYTSISQFPTSFSLASISFLLAFISFTSCSSSSSSSPTLFGGCPLQLWLAGFNSTTVSTVID